MAPFDHQTFRCPRCGGHPFGCRCLVNDTGALRAPLLKFDLAPVPLYARPVPVPIRPKFSGPALTCEPRKILVFDLPS